MPADLHPLYMAFPEQRELLRQLRQEDANLGRMADEYDALHRAIESIESGARRVDEALLGILLEERAGLRAEIANSLEYASRCASHGCEVL